MRRDRSVRTGMFWRFGSVEESRPVAAPAGWNVVWIRPSAGSMSCGSASTYVPFSLESERCSSTSRGSSCWSASFSSTSWSVDGPVFSRFSTGSSSSVKSTCASSRVEATLKRRPAATWIRASRSSIARPNSSLIPLMAPRSTRMPIRSISKSTGTTGASTSR